MPSIELEEACSQDATPTDARTDATPRTASSQALLKNAVQSRYFGLVEEGFSPNSAAASAIRDVGSNKATLPGEMFSSDEASDDAAPRHLRFDVESDPTPPHAREEPIASHMQRSGSAPTLLAQSSGSSPQLTGHRNKDVWKTFGIHMPAGRLLKNLYGGGKVDPVPGSLKQSLPRRFGPPSELDTYMAVNNMKLGTPGLQYRKSMNIFDICKGGQEFVRWGDSVEGYRLDASWLQVGDRYLPTTVNSIQMLKRWQGSEALRAEGLRRQQSLPPLKKLPRGRSNPCLSVGGVGCGF